MKGQYIHTICGGKIDTSRRKCNKCGKHWNLLSFWTTTSIRPAITVKQAKKVVKPAPRNYAKWAEGTPAGKFASYLPKWPRWARILLTSVFVFLLLFIANLIWHWWW